MKIILTLSLLLFGTLCKADFGTFWTIELNKFGVRSQRPGIITNIFLKNIDVNDTLIFSYNRDTPATNTISYIEIRTSTEKVIFQRAYKLEEEWDPIKIPLNEIREKIKHRDELFLFFRNEHLKQLTKLASFVVHSDNKPVETKKTYDWKNILIVMLSICILILLLRDNKRKYGH